MKPSSLPRILVALLMPLLLWSSPQARADVALLIHGYLGSGDTWRVAGVEQTLSAGGWGKAGTWVAQPQGPQLFAEQAAIASDVYYPVALPAGAPLTVQTDALEAIVRAVAARHPDTPLHLIGHSAGGVVARLKLLRHGPGGVASLITIASPHLGTERAWQAIEATNGGGLFGPFKKLLTKQAIGADTYHAVEGSRGLLADLGPAIPGSLLFWMNQQAHPDLRYVSIIRTAGYNMGGDMIVPAFSQDMNQVPTLRGRSEVVPVVQEHLLTPVDGQILLALLGNGGTRSNP
ncbi:MAG: esterase/lipase family protein [Thiotrichales bacterium]